MQRAGRMHIGTAREFFSTLASRGHDPRLVDASGVWQFDIDGAGTWQLKVDHGAFTVDEGARSSPSTEIKMSEAALVKLANGEGHENLQTALLRGVVRVGGDFRFAQKLWAIVPFPEEWRTAS
jgi:hypothetical protein